MRQIKNRLLTITVTLLAISALSNSAVVAQAPQMSEEKTALYTKYYEKKTGLDAANRYLQGLSQ